MTSPRLKPAELPGWPRWLSEELAAAYVGLGQEAFRQEVDAGIWPAARGAGLGGRRKVWDRQALDQKSDELSNPVNDEKKLMREALRGPGNVRSLSSY